MKQEINADKTIICILTTCQITLSQRLIQFFYSSIVYNFHKVSVDEYANGGPVASETANETHSLFISLFLFSSFFFLYIVE